MVAAGQAATRFATDSGVHAEDYAAPRCCRADIKRLRIVALSWKRTQRAWHQCTKRLGATEGIVSEGGGAMTRPVRMLSCSSLLLATVAVLLAAVGIAVACHDLEYFRTKQDCEHQFENEIRRSYDDPHDHARSREIACCALMRANQCIRRLHDEKPCEDVSHETLLHFSRKARNWNCESFDYTPCGSGASIASASILLLGALLAFVVNRS